MKPVLRVLIVEDSEFDAQMITSLIRKSGYDVITERVETAEVMQRSLQQKKWDIILSDYNLPSFSAPEALKLVQASGLDLPFIIISGGIGEATAVAAMKAGAHDYLMKGNLNRLSPAIERELREAANRRERREAREKLLESELRYRLLWESSPDAVLLMDSESKIHFVNPAVETVFGHKPEEIVGQTLRVLLPEELRSNEAVGIEQYLRTGEKKLIGRTVETIGRHKDGRDIVIEVSFSHMELHGQRRYVAFVRDITARKRAEHELRENQEQFQVAREIQQRLFPKTSPEIPGFDIAGVTYPAEATGGDYFDYLSMNNGNVGIVVADVTGHGIGPALLMAETRAYLRTLAANREGIGDILTAANSILAEDVGSERFVTLFLGKLEPKIRRFCYSSAGHPTGYLLGPGGEIKALLKRTGVPLGIRPETKYGADVCVELNTGDTILLLTDGIEETLGTGETFFGIERTLEVVRQNRAKPSREILDTLYRAARDFSQGAPQLDDVTAILIKVLERPNSRAAVPAVLAGVSPRNIHAGETPAMTSETHAPLPGHRSCDCGPSSAGLRLQFMNACVIFNPAARGDKARRLRSQLDVIARDAALKPTTRIGDAQRLAAEAVREGFETIVSAGGDGTVNEVLNGIAEADGFSRARLGVLPMGTVNVFAKELRLPERFDEAWQTIQRGREMWVDAPRANYIAAGQSHRRYFAQMAGAGLDSRAVELVSWELKKRVGYLAYVVAGFQAFSEKLPLIEVTSGSERVSGQLVLIGNGKFYGGRFSVFPLADLCDGVLEVVVFPKVKVETLLRSTWGAITDDFHTGNHTVQLKSSRIEVNCAAPISFHLDGENVAPLPVTFSVEPRALRVIVP